MNGTLATNHDAGPAPTVTAHYHPPGRIAQRLSSTPGGSGPGRRGRPQGGRGARNATWHRRARLPVRSRLPQGERGAQNATTRRAQNAT